MQTLSVVAVIVSLLLLVGCATQTEYTGNFVRLNQPHRIIQHDFSAPYLVVRAEPKSLVTQERSIVDAPPATNIPVKKKTDKTSTRWAVQVVALDRSQTEDLTSITDHVKLIGFPSYIAEIDQLGKVRLGPFPDLEDAKLVLSVMRQNGYPDAFLLKEAQDINKR